MSEKMISLDEAKTALRCMRLADLSEEEALDCLDEVADRVRKVTISKIVENIIENSLTDIQRQYIKMYWYEQKNATQIARECGVAQAGVYKTIDKANEKIKELMTPVVMYSGLVSECEVIPIAEEALEICSARKSVTQSFCEELRNLRVGNAIATETLARALKITERELSEIESGHRIPSIVTVMRYSVLFGMEITMTFVNGKGKYKWKKV